MNDFLSNIRLDQVPPEEEDRLIAGYFDIFNTQGREAAETFLQQLSAVKREKITPAISALNLLRDNLKKPR